MPKSNENSDKKLKNIYFDYASSIEANPSSVHKLGVLSKKKLENARLDVAGILGARVSEIIFTSGGTESNNLAIQGIILAWHEENQEKKVVKILPHIITTNIEHPSVLETYKILEKRKFAQISIVPVEKNGIVEPKKIKKEIKSNTILISVMYVNNEIGTIQPIKEIAKEIRHYRKNMQTGNFPLFHTDAVQAVNYLDLNVEKLGVDLLSLSGSKIEESGKVGLLYKKKSVLLMSIFGGGDQEWGVRPGTENLPEILKFSTALKLAQDIKEKEGKRLIKLRDYFLKKLPVGFVLNGDLKNRLPNNLNISFQNIPSDLLVVELSEKGIMASSKSACESSKVGISYVIKAINPEMDSKIGGIRFSLGRQTTKNDIDYTIQVLNKILNKLKKWYN